MFYHSPQGFVLVLEDRDACLCAQMKVPKHMTGRQRGYQQLFRIVFGSLPSKGWVGGPVQDRLPIHLDGMASFISPVCAGSEACISGPFNANLVFLPTRHAVAVIVVY